MTLPTSGQLSIEDLKKELRIDIPTGVGPTAFDLSENLQLLLARTKPGAANKNFPLILPDDFWGTRRPNDPIDFSSQIAGGVFTRNFTATRATEGATTIRFKVWRAGNVLHGQIVDKGAVSTTFGIIPEIATSYAGVTDDHDIEVKIDLLSGSPSVAPVYGVFKVADATAQEIEVDYPGPYIGQKLIQFRMTVRQQDLPSNSFQAVISLLAENTFVPETPYDAAANLNKGMWANVVSESDAYTHAIYSFVLRSGAQGYGYYLWRNANGQNGFDDYHFLGPWRDSDTLQFNIGVNAFNQSGGMGTGTPVGSWAFRNGAVNWQWQDITTTEKGVHSIGNRRLNSLNITVQVRSKNTGRVYQVATINVASEVTIASWSMPVVNFPKAIGSSTSNNVNVQAGMKIYRDASSGQILLVPKIALGTAATYWNWTGGSGYLNGNVPLTSRAIPEGRIQVNWDTGGSGASGGVGSLLLTNQDYNSAPTWLGILRGVNGQYNESVWISFTDTWTGAGIWGGHQFIFNQTRNYNPPPPNSPYTPHGDIVFGLHKDVLNSSGVGSFKIYGDPAGKLVLTWMDIQNTAYQVTKKVTLCPGGGDFRIRVTNSKCRPSSSTSRSWQFTATYQHAGLTDDNSYYWTNSTESNWKQLDINRMGMPAQIVGQLAASPYNGGELSDSWAVEVYDYKAGRVVDTFVAHGEIFVW